MVEGRYVQFSIDAPQWVRGSRSDAGRKGTVSRSRVRALRRLRCGCAAAFAALPRLVGQGIPRLDGLLGRSASAQAESAADPQWGPIDRRGRPELQPAE